MFNRKYINEPRLFHTGFLANDSLIRIKQDLPLQELSNTCQYLEPNSIDNGYLERNGAFCNNKLLYPFPAVPLIYDQNINKQKYPVKPETNMINSINQDKAIPQQFVKFKLNNELMSGEIPNCCNCATYVMPI